MAVDFTQLPAKSQWNAAIFPQYSRRLVFCSQYCSSSVVHVNYSCLEKTVLITVRSDKKYPLDKLPYRYVACRNVK